MGYFSKFQESLDLTRDLKSRVPIAIYGSFSPGYKERLIELKTMLSDGGYFAVMSFDFEALCPIPPGADPDSYNLVLSKVMSRIAEIHVIMIFKEGRDEHGIDNSVTIELDTLSTYQREHVIILHEEGCIRQLGSLLRARINLGKRVRGWESYGFYRDKKESFMRLIEHFSLKRMKKNENIGYDSMEDLNDHIPSVYIEELRKEGLI